MVDFIVIKVIYQLYLGIRCTYPCFCGVLLTCTPYNILSKLLSHITIVETMDSSERGINPDAMTIISPRKEDWRSQGLNQ